MNTAPMSVIRYAHGRACSCRRSHLPVEAQALYATMPHGRLAPLSRWRAILRHTGRLISPEGIPRRLVRAFSARTHDDVCLGGSLAAHIRIACAIHAREPRHFTSAQGLTLLSIPHLMMMTKLALGRAGVDGATRRVFSTQWRRRAAIDVMPAIHTYWTPHTVALPMMDH